MALTTAVYFCIADILLWWPACRQRAGGTYCSGSFFLLRNQVLILNSFINSAAEGIANAAGNIVPETLLKKRKSDKKVRDQKLAKSAEQRKVCCCIRGSTMLGKPPSM